MFPESPQPTTIRYNPDYYMFPEFPSVRVQDDTINDYMTTIHQWSAFVPNKLTYKTKQYMLHNYSKQSPVSESIIVVL